MKRTVAVLVAVLAAAWLQPRSAYPHNPTTTTVLFNREIAALLQRKCLSCHAEGKLAMPLVTFANARPWAQAIKEEVLARRMPPWPAERGYGSFSNDVGLTPREFEFLLSWIDGGAPQGVGEPPPFVDHSAHWMLGTPDIVLTPPAGTTVQPGSPPAFTRLEIETGLTRDGLVRGFDFKPGNARVARAAFFSVAGTNQYLGGWTPWHASTELPEGVAYRIPARARIAVEVLYSGTTGPVTDIPQLGLYTVPSARSGLVTTSLLRPVAPVGAAGPGGRFVAELRFPSRRALVSMRPELPLGVRSLEVKLLRPDGSREVLLWIRRVRQDWPTPFVFRQPVELAAGSVLQATAYVDTSGVSAQTPFTIAVNHYGAPERR